VKRDLELIRKLLLFFDDKPGPEHIQAPPIPGYDDITIKILFCSTMPGISDVNPYDQAPVIG